MKMARWALVCVGSMVSAGMWASHGDAQVGRGAGGRPEGIGLVTNSSKPAETIVAPATSVRRLGMAELKILAALKEPVNFDFTETPLNDVLTFIKDNHDLQIYLNSRVLSDAGIDPTTLPITSNLKGISVRSALNLILRPQGLTWLIRDEVMMITTIDEAKTLFETRIYDIHALVAGDANAKNSTSANSLIKTIVSSVNDNWHENGGNATICAYGDATVRAIVVTQTYDGHEQIEALLTELRRLSPQR